MKEKMASQKVEIHTRPINVQNIGLLKEINAATLPVSYAEKFYTDIVKTPKEITHYAYSGSVCIGAICCRVETEVSGKEDKSRVYIMTLGVLAPYRNRGVGRELLEGVLEHVDTQMSSVSSIYLHVWVKNKEAMRFYEKFDFVEKETVQGYYKRVSPPDAIIWERNRKVEKSVVRAAAAY
jgi:N-alpha-acetyltransferase 50